MAKIKQQDVYFEWCMDKSDAKSEVINFWHRMNVDPKAFDFDRRSQYVALTARSPTGEIIAITTAERTLIRRLNHNYFFNYRILISPEVRYPGLADKMGVTTIQQLEYLWSEGKTDCIGLITLVENEHLKKYRKEMVWASTKFTFIGVSNAGSHIRVRYFKGARI
ncbi:hypothetical protein FNH22_07225 [Fulvivirga sp. M361]|uniref:hypothetical protein n=1 Tax=Fulvivirga sp. M361 TaxID=2594266 RepID=UPI00117B7282|nr:hypothetical protein [Fulvivirga sp. M361]TRX60825.1 hypothetical protein FNH22_07225 [Fulvivirga sp. M361]